ncbi:unnamed protein product [Triticum turgidum subsp. durum]|uniref:Protein kinase domain-containing protein n=1 Tax=Triticum turgidum subsp. durum TaxID=4567 RepID=A0A9R1RT64_TRITD|nr:unnamed protein product [Triticum turgidum subsp. durum]
MDHPESIITQLIHEEHKSKWIARRNHNVKCFTEDEIKRFTDNYKTLLGRGAFGEVYQGVLEDKRMVAVKKYICNVKENFAKELTVHREINHKNVVRLVGYCVDENALMVVMEYIPKGNLSDILHRDSIPIALDTRLRIAIECAEALGYMHSQMYTQVIHGDIKPANILLDDGLSAKISDFGISRLVNTKSSNILLTGTHDACVSEHGLMTLGVFSNASGYRAPEVTDNRSVSQKADVYSFGILMLEVLTRKDPAKSTQNEEGLDLARWVCSITPEEWRAEVFDVELLARGQKDGKEECMVRLMQLGLKCCSQDADSRPTMSDVVQRIEEIGQS